MSHLLLAQGFHFQAPRVNLGAFELMIIGVVVCVVVSTVMNAWRAAGATRLGVDLKREMLDRGMSADEIARVVSAKVGDDADDAEGVNLPCASEVVVEVDGEWLQALVLQVADGRYYVHYVGGTMEENGWVSPDKVRFPAGSHLPEMVSRLRHDRNGAPQKEPAEAEL